MDVSPPPSPAPVAPLAYSADRPRRPTLHLWIAAAGAMLLQLPWVYIIGMMLWDGMAGESGLVSLRGVVTLGVLALPSLLAATLVLLAVGRSR